MRWLFAFAFALVGCGRIGFDPPRDAGPSDDGPSDDGGMESRAALLPCNTRVLLDDGGDLEQDGLAWVRDGADDWMVAILHVSDTDHPIERFAIEASATGLRVRDTGAIHQTNHPHHLGMAPVAGGHVMGFYDDGAATTYGIRFAPGLVELEAHPLAGLADGAPPLARSTGGGLAVVGVTAGRISVRGLADNATLTGTQILLGSPADGLDFPTLVSIDDGLAVVWQAATTGRCQLATLHADLTLAAGPVDMALGACTRPQVAWLDGPRRIVVVADDANTGGVTAAIWDAALTPTTAPLEVAASGFGAQVIAEGDSAWVAWVASAGEAMRYARIASDGSLTAGSSLGRVDTSYTHYHVLQSVDGYPVALWGDVAQNVSFAAARLCR